MRLNQASALLLSLLLPACAGSGIPTPVTTKILDTLPRVHNSPSAPCWQQKEIAAQNSYVDTVTTQREVVYKAPCEVDTKKAPVKVAGG